MNGKVWSDKAIDYKAGLDIYDPVDMVIYSDEQAKTLPQEVKSRLVIKPRKIGTWVNKA